MRWEHKLVEFRPKAKLFGVRYDVADLERELRKLGDEGWELVSLSGVHELSIQTSALVACLKRPRPEDPGPAP